MMQLQQLSGQTFQLDISIPKQLYENYNLKDHNGIVTVQASWNGNKQYNGSESTQVNIVIVPTALIATISVGLPVGSLVTVEFSKRKRTSKNVFQK